EVADLHRKGGLAHRAIFGRAAKMTVAGERREVTQLTQRDHADKLRLSRHALNTIGPYLIWGLRPPTEGTGTRRTEQWTPRPTTRARANARSPAAATEIEIGGRTHWTSRCCIGTPTCPIRWARTSTTPKNSSRSISMR